MRVNSTEILRSTRLCLHPRFWQRLMAKHSCLECVSSSFNESGSFVVLCGAQENPIFLRHERIVLSRLMLSLDELTQGNELFTAFCYLARLCMCFGFCIPFMPVFRLQKSPCICSSRCCTRSFSASSWPTVRRLCGLHFVLNTDCAFYKLQASCFSLMRGALVVISMQRRT